MHAEERFLGSHVRALTIELGRRDAYTEQHTRRVALRAVQVGERLGLSKRHLRNLAIGGLLHDIGKLAVPDAILKKPGPLDDVEYAVIKRHTEWGTRLLDQIGGFPKTVRRLVRDHHERLDGTGYPEPPHRRGARPRHADPLGLRRLRRADLVARLPRRRGRTRRRWRCCASRSARPSTHAA